LIIIQPLRDVEGGVLTYLRQGIAKELGVEVRISEINLKLPIEAFDELREQYNADKVLSYLRKVVKVKRGKVLGVVNGDGYSPGLNFVFGEAELNGNYGVIFLERLKEEFYGKPSSRELFLIRSLKEALHEIGHLYGLTHCPNPRCVMHFSNSISDTDIKEASYCRRCRELLGARLELR